MYNCSCQFVFSETVYMNMLKVHQNKMGFIDWFMLLPKISLKHPLPAKNMSTDLYVTL